jgi:3-hydroxyacyl-[acyl-carrier-protein] dehydratase
MDDKATTLQSFDIQRILELLPHRYPFLLIDRIVEAHGDDTAIGIKAVTVNEPFFAGHFPRMPIMPGVLLIEGMAQTAAAICAANLGLTEPTAVYFTTIDQAKFRKPVTPGETIAYHVQKLRNRGNIWKYRAEARVNGVKVAEAVISAMIGDKTSAA